MVNLQSARSAILFLEYPQPWLLYLGFFLFSFPLGFLNYKNDKQTTGLAITSK